MSSSSSLFREIAEIIIGATVGLIAIEAFVSVAFSANNTFKSTLPPLIEALAERREKNNNPLSKEDQETQTKNQ